MKNSVLETISACWQKLSLHERREFLAFEAAQLCVAFCEARDNNIELFHKNLVALADFADTMCEEMERRQQKDALQQSFSALHDEIVKDGFTKHVAEALEALSEGVRLYLEEVPSEEEYEEADEDAYSNIIAAMKSEEALVDELVSA